MKRSLAIIASVAALFLVASTLRTFAADTEVTVTGKAACAKCVLKEKNAKTCQTVIEVKRENGNPQKYYVTENEVGKKFHSEVCQATKKVIATGTVKNVKGKRELTLSKIELVK